MLAPLWFIANSARQQEIVSLNGYIAEILPSKVFSETDIFVSQTSRLLGLAIGDLFLLKILD